MPAIFDLSATVCFACAILHTFSVDFFEAISSRYSKNSLSARIFYLLGEVELVFALWAFLWLLFVGTFIGFSTSWAHIKSLNFTEPAFVFVILTVCSSAPILQIASSVIQKIADLLPLPKPIAFFSVSLVIGPILGSLITEPAAMTVTALTLLDRFFSKRLSDPLKYATLGLLFVNVSVGGTLTHFAAPPVLMVASVWQWDLSHMLLNFGWKGILSSVLSTSLFAFVFRKELRNLSWEERLPTRAIPTWVSALHILFLFAIVYEAHHAAVFAVIFVAFLGTFWATRKFQSDLKFTEGALVGLFLAGLVVLGKPQHWWLEPLLTQLDTWGLYFGAIGLTAFTDNAAITYLGAQVPNLSEGARYALVAGAVVGGGLTVIANAPNPAGYGILNASFGDRGIEPFKLFKAALIPTLIATICFWL